MQAPRDYQVLFVDMDAFFASCEQQSHSVLRDKPIGIAPYTGPSGCVIARSYEAKKLGIKVGMRVSEARAICPELIIVESDTKKYLGFHQKIVTALKSITPFLKVKSVDEFRIALSPSEQNRDRSTALARKIKTAIADKIGQYLSCSAGTGPNTFLAKMAAEQDKPNGLTIIKLDQLISFYNQLELTDLTGINSRMERRLHFAGINSPLEFYQHSAQNLREKFGIWGDYWYLRLRGWEIDEAPTKTKNLGHSHVLPPEFRQPDRAVSVLQKLVAKAGQRLRNNGFWAGGIYLAVRFEDRSSYHRGKKVAPFCDSQTFFRHALDLYRQALSHSADQRPLLLAVSAFNLTSPVSEQPPLFPKHERQFRLYRALDQINDHYGPFTIKPAALIQVETAAPDRIPFGLPAPRLRRAGKPRSV